MRSFIGLGGNMPGTASAFGGAVRELRMIGNILGASSLYQASPRDHFDQPDFTNAVIELETDLEPADLLFALKRLEMTLGRDPHGMRFGPRLIDLDILVVEGRCVDDAELDLVIPHPRLAERRFALEPLAELDPRLRPWRGCTDPRSDLTVQELLPRVVEQQVTRVGGSEWAD